MDVGLIALTLGSAWASGLNLYAAVATLGILGATGNATLPQDLQILTNPLVITVACLLYAVEFLADKIPGVDSMWDAVHTFIRIPAGAVLAAGAVGGVDPAITAVAFLLGGAVSAGSHGTKMSTRLMINTSPEPFSNWTASIAEDVAVVGGLYMALNHPISFLFLLGLFVALVIWLIPKIFRVLRGAVLKTRSLFGSRERVSP